MSEEVDPLIGMPITGSYVVRSKLAEGGMGAVYVAVNDLGNKKVVKVLLPYASQHPQIRERFDREARAAAKLSGRPHIVTIDDVGRLPNGQQFLTMEFLHGRTLEAHMSQHGRVSPHHAFMLLVQIAWGLHELHMARLVHRDLKPGNVFLVPNRENHAYYVVLIDLGIAHDATLVDSDPQLKTQTGMAMGTPGYMAPEQFGDAGSVTPASDIYALAIILYEMLVGRRPWDAPTTHVLYHLQQTQPASIPADVEMPDAWRRIIESALAKNPQARPQTAYDFVAALASELHGDDRLGVQSGAQMMASFARSLVNQALPNSETIRVRGQAPGPMMWTPPRLTDQPIGHHAAVPISVPSAGSKLGPTVNERPGDVRSQNPTTIGGSSGVFAPTTPPVRSRGTLIAIALTTVGLAAAVTVGVMRFVRSDSASSDGDGIAPAGHPRSENTAEPPDAGPTLTIDAEPTVAATQARLPDASVVQDATIADPPRDASFANSGSNRTKTRKSGDSTGVSDAGVQKSPVRVDTGSGDDPKRKKFDPDEIAE